MIGSFVVAKARALFPVPAANMKFAAIPDKSVMHLGMVRAVGHALVCAALQGACAKGPVSAQGFPFPKLCCHLT